MVPTSTIGRLLGIAALLCAASRACGQCELAKLTDPDGGSSDIFGKTLCLGAGRLVVGVPAHDVVAPNSGIVYVYEFDDMEWSSSDTLLPPDGGGNGSDFGRAVASSGDILVATSLSRARGYVYVWDEIGSWAYTAEVMASDYNPEDAFGETADMDGDTIVIGAPWDNNANGGDAGSVYVFDREPNGEWVQTQNLLATDGQSSDELGIALAIQDSALVVGAWRHSVGGALYSGQAYVFEREAMTGEWSQSAVLRPPVSYSLQGFGLAVAVSGGTVMVAATNDRTAAPNAGAVYVYDRQSDGTWSLAQSLFAADAANSDFFGSSVALDDACALIGARSDDDQATNAGAAYLFVRDADGVWRQHAKFTASDGQYYDQFGYSVALDGSWAVIGAPYDDDNGPGSGSAYIFRVGPDWSGNGVPDICECPGDIDYSGAVGLSDLSALLTNFGLAAGQSYESGDIDGDYDVDLGDLSALLERYGVACP